MGVALDYRQLAAEQKRAADETNLRMVKLMHQSAALRWEAMADEIERCELSRMPQVRQQIFM